MSALATKGDVSQVIRQYLKPGDVAIDGGVADGVELQAMVDAVGPTGAVMGIEPDPRYRDHLADQVYTCPVRLEWKALDRISGITVDLHLSGTPNSSSLYRDAVKEKQPSTVAIETVCLDDLPFLERVRCVKLDLQGHECAALEGASRLLALKPTWIVECWPKGLRIAGTSARALVDRFRQAGYTVRWMGGDAIEDAAFDAWAEAVTDSYCNLLMTP